jgi:integrase/recombinase XerD
MTTWPDPERRLIARYLAGLGLRRASCAYYKQVLNSFQDVAECHAELGKDVLIAWLQTLSGHWMATTLLNRTRVIDRFLDHLVRIGAIERNPVAALCEACNIKAMSAGLARTGVA